jgi:hypothetical protein
MMKRPPRTRSTTTIATATAGTITITAGTARPERDDDAAQPRLADVAAVHEPSDGDDDDDDDGGGGGGGGSESDRANRESGRAG